MKKQNLRHMVKLGVHFSTFAAIAMGTFAAHAQPTTSYRDVDACPNCAPGSKRPRLTSEFVSSVKNVDRHLIRINVFGSDKRHRSDRLEEETFSFVGRTVTSTEVMYSKPGNDGSETTTSKGFGVGNGVMVSPCLMIMNYHGVFGDIDFHPARKVKHFVTVSVGTHREVAMALDWGDLSAGDQGDWAIIVLQRCAGSDPSVRYAKTSAMKSFRALKEPIIMVGFPGDKPDGYMQVEKDCRIRDASTPVLEHDCASFAGSSGSGLFNQRGELFAIHSEAMNPSDHTIPKYDSFYANHAVSMDWIFSNSRLREWIENDIAHPGHPFGVKP